MFPQKKICTKIVKSHVKTHPVILLTGRATITTCIACIQVGSRAKLVWFLHQLRHEWFCMMIEMSSITHQTVTVTSLLPIQYGLVLLNKLDNPTHCILLYFEKKSNICLHFLEMRMGIWNTYSTKIKYCLTYTLTTRFTCLTQSISWL